MGQLNTHFDNKYIEAQRLTDDHKNQIFNKVPIMLYLLLQKKVLLNEGCIRRMARWLLQGDRYSTCVITDLREKGGRGSVKPDYRTASKIIIAEASAQVVHQHREYYCEQIVQCKRTLKVQLFGHLLPTEQKTKFYRTKLV